MDELIRRIESELIINTKAEWIKTDEQTKEQPYWNSHEVMQVLSKVLNEWDYKGRRSKTALGRLDSK